MIVALSVRLVMVPVHVETVVLELIRITSVRSKIRRTRAITVSKTVAVMVRDLASYGHREQFVSIRAVPATRASWLTRAMVRERVTTTPRKPVRVGICATARERSVALRVRATCTVRGHYGSVMTPINVSLVCPMARNARAIINV